MIINPIYKKERMVSDRSIRMTLIITIFNFIIATVTLIGIVSTIEVAKITAQIQYDTFLSIFRFVTAIEFVLIIFLMPALTCGSISGEREKNTLELMLTTKMTPADIVLGKLMAALSTVVLLIVSGMPIISLVFMYGGATIKDIVLLFLSYFVAAYYIGSIGIFASSICKKSSVSAAVTYIVVLMVVLGTLAINMFYGELFIYEVADYIELLGSRSIFPNMLLYILIVNPVSTFYLSIISITSNYDVLNNIINFSGATYSALLLDNWFLLGNILQLSIAAVLNILSIRMISPRLKRIKAKNK